MANSATNGAEGSNPRRTTITTNSILGFLRLLMLPSLIFFMCTTYVMYNMLDNVEDEFISGYSNQMPSVAGLSKKLSHKFGDKSPRYRELREEYDAKFPPELIQDRANTFLKTVRKRHYEAMYSKDVIGYDVFNCPDDPPKDYPAEFPTLDILDHWAANDATPRTHIHQGICVFDFNTEYDKAMRYREAERPFVIRDDPAVLQTVERWNQPDYLRRVLNGEKHRTEYSLNNQFMYWRIPSKKKNGKRKKGNAPEGWKPPTEIQRIKYEDWLAHANVTDDKLGPDKPHWYYRLIGCGTLSKDCDKIPSEFLFDELTFFQPTLENPLYMVKPDQQQGIHCRFGMKGVTAENHFDGSRNVISLLGGERRYILTHPKECKHLCLYPRGHPSSRHSEIDWSDPDVEQFPAFKNAKSNEIVLQAGDVLYLPTDWFHHIISLDLNFQCNTRSGVTRDFHKDMEHCGFS